ncbi:hypothetical protein [Nonomuraea typhae]|uniref:hypothetical protein n=1 Tax=Nonomuraea typhae TaxID=2603600 RepID=UPI0012FA8715|nr:hypothetical protein [Nonomuraea typhae]
MAQTPHDQAYDRAQARLTRDAARRYQQPDWGAEDPRARDAYDRELARTMPVRGQERR